jgi:hypothetical protein
MTGHCTCLWDHGWQLLAIDPECPLLDLHALTPEETVSKHLADKHVPQHARGHVSIPAAVWHWLRKLVRA